MCECTLIADGEFSPITICENKLRFVYRDKHGVEHVLLKEFEMDITITRAQVSKLTNEAGELIGYQFNVF